MGIGTNPDGNVRPKSEPCSAMKVYSARIYDRALTQEEIQQNIKAENIIN